MVRDDRITLRSVLGGKTLVIIVDLARISYKLIDLIAILHSGSIFKVKYMHFQDGKYNPLPVIDRAFIAKLET
jgi:hypothetical protein